MKHISNAVRIAFSLLLLTATLCACGRQSAETQPTVPETTAFIETLPPETQEPTVAETEPEPVTYDTVPLYFQTDYPYIK